jgi:hypothetical protein
MDGVPPVEGSLNLAGYADIAAPESVRLSPGTNRKNTSVLRAMMRPNGFLRKKTPDHAPA